MRIFTLTDIQPFSQPPPPPPCQPPPLLRHEMGLITFHQFKLYKVVRLHLFDQKCFRMYVDRLGNLFYLIIIKHLLVTLSSISQLCVSIVCMQSDMVTKVTAQKCWSCGRESQGVCIFNVEVYKFTTYSSMENQCARVTFRYRGDNFGRLS